MKKRLSLKQKDTSQFKRSGSPAGKSRRGVVPLQDARPKRGGEGSSQDLNDWLQTAAAEGLAQQQEVLQWWSQFRQCCTDVDCSSRKVRTLWERLASTIIGSADAALRLAFDQQSAAMNLFRHSQRFSAVLSPGEFQIAMDQCLADVEDRARAWGMIPLTSQAKAASAWAEFWSLPPSPERGI